MVEKKFTLTVIKSPRSFFAPRDPTCWHIPFNVLVKVVASEASISELARLAESEYLGIDIEWKHFWKPFNTKKLSILILSSEKMIFIIDFKELSTSKSLDN